LEPRETPAEDIAGRFFSMTHPPSRGQDVWCTAGLNNVKTYPRPTPNTMEFDVQPLEDEWKSGQSNFPDITHATDELSRKHVMK
jgi:hypothetical protein